MSKKCLIFGDGTYFDYELYNMLKKSKIYDEVSIISIHYPEDPKLREVTKTITFNNLHQDWNLIRCDHLYYTATSNINPYKKTKDKLKTELDNFYQLTKIARHNGVSTFLLKSYSGSSPSSFKYIKKSRGKIERALLDLNFPSTHIFKPYVLLGDSKILGSEQYSRRVFIKFINFFLRGILKKYKGLPVHQFFGVMIDMAKKEKKGTFIHSNKEMHALFSKT